MNRGDTVRVPLLWIAIGLSLLLHGVLMWQWRHEAPLPPTPEKEGKGKTEGRLRTQIAPPPAAPRERAPAEKAAPPAPARAQAAGPRPPPPRVAAAPPAVNAPASPPVLARPGPGPEPRVRPEPPAQQQQQPAAPAAAEDDLAALVEANRRRRAGPLAATPEAAPSRERTPAEENERRDRTIAANLGSLKAPMVGESGRRGGGVFELRRVGLEDAEFLFYGWNKDMGRNNTQLVEVRRGTNANMRIAVIRRMVAIIREHEKGDFVWESRRLNRNVNLSARVTDAAELEAFLMTEFF